MQISSTSRERLGDRLVVASISGGKDSTALALTLMQHEIPHVRVFADTGFEAPETYDYLDLLRERLGPIEVVRNESLWQGAQPGEEGMLTLIRRKQMFPSRLMRFCTQQLKIFPIRDHIRVMQDRGDEVVSAVGVRAEESAARAAMAEWEFWDEMDAEIWRPLIHWSEQDVIEVHRRHNMPPNPLYLARAASVVRPASTPVSTTSGRSPTDNSSRSGVSSRNSPRTRSLVVARARHGPSSNFAAPRGWPSPRSTRWSAAPTSTAECRSRPHRSRPAAPAGGCAALRTGPPTHPLQRQPSRHRRVLDGSATITWRPSASPRIASASGWRAAP